jgi:hypothetical protein
VSRMNCLIPNKLFEVLSSGLKCNSLYKSPFHFFLPSNSSYRVFTDQIWCTFPSELQCQRVMKYTKCNASFTDLLDGHYMKYFNLQRTFKKLFSAEITLYIFKHHWLILVNISELSGSTKYGKFLDQLSECFPPQGPWSLKLFYSNLF